MSHLEILRFRFTEESTTGIMFLDGAFECFTLEDRIRASSAKVMHKTAIPSGQYKVVIDHSPRFQKMMPHVLDVPGFDGIRIHPGNTSDDTSGCILVGSIAGVDSIAGSKTAYEALMPKLLGGAVLSIFNRNPPMELLV